MRTAQRSQKARVRTIGRSNKTDREDTTEGQQDVDETPDEEADPAEVENDSFDDEEDEDNKMGMEPLM